VLKDALPALISPADTPIEANSGDITPLDYLLSVVRDPNADQRVRIQAASIAAPFVHVKKGEGGKKEAATTAAKQATAGRFSPASAPKLVVNNR